MPTSPDLPHNQSLPDPDSFLMGGGVPSASFLKIGRSVTGTITEKPQVQQQRDMNTGNPKVWEDGNPMLQLVVTLQTDEHDADIEDDDGRRRIYLKSNMKRAVSDAVRKAKANGLEVGGKLTVTYTGDGEPTKRGFNPPKLYDAEYEPPANVVLNDASDDDGPAKRNTTTGRVTGVEEDQRGDIKFWHINTTNGRFGTRDKSLADWARDYETNGVKVEVGYEQVGQGLFRAVSINAAEQPQQGLPQDDGSSIPF